LLPPRPDEDERRRVADRLPPAPLFFVGARRDEGPASFAVLRSLARLRSLLIVWR
jgi:hypothetical protein